MFIVNREEMSLLDRETITNIGIPQRVLMENAGRAVYSVLREELDVSLSESKVVVILGKGNNAGDGLVTARYLLDRTGELKVYILDEKARLRGSAGENLSSFLKIGGRVEEVKRITRSLEGELKYSHCVIDAVFGTGFTGEVKGIYKKVFELINSSEGIVLSIDIPSGVDADTGEVKNTAVMADVTVTMGFPKLGNILYPGRIFTGKLIVADIGIPEVLARERVRQQSIEKEEIAGYIPIRFGFEHKGNFGRVLILSGSRGYTGAASLSSQAVLKVGAGLSYLAIPETLNPILETKVTEVITIPLADKNGMITEDAGKEILALPFDFDCIGAGPGLMREKPVREAIIELIKEYQYPLVLDADAVAVLKDNKKLIKSRKGPLVLTPHPGEFGYLMGLTPSYVDRNRVELTREFSEEYRCFLVMKGAPTVVGTPEGRVWVNTTGNPGLASGGTGDVLLGMITGFIAQGISPEEACLLGVYLHGLAGDIAVDELTQLSITAGDLLDYIPIAIKTLISKEEKE